jgi:hypothetical protein
MSDALALMFAIKAVSKLGRSDDARAIPEPEFKPFVFHPTTSKVVKMNSTRTKTVAPANTARSASTLAELGVPGNLASEMELLLGLMGSTKGSEVVGYTFVTPDGASHALRLSKAELSEKATKAA